MIAIVLSFSGKKQNGPRVEEYLLKYLSNKDNKFKTEILLLTEEPDLSINRESINSLKTETVRRLHNLRQSQKDYMREDRLDEFLILREKFERRLNFLNDLEMLYKLFVKKGIEADYRKMLSVLEKLITEKFDDVLAIPLSETFEKVKNKLAGETNKEKVLSICIRQSMIDKKMDGDLAIVFLLRLFDKFGLKCNLEEIARLLRNVAEEVALEEFEEKLGSAKKIRLEDLKDLDGHAFESWLEKLFKLLGYNVIRLRQVADQGADLIISKNNEKVVVQAKKHEEKISNKAIQEVVAAKKYYKVNKALVVTNSSFTKSATDLAISNDVELWDGNKLKGIIESL